MKALLFCAAVLFPYTFWVITKILPSKIEPQATIVDTCIFLNEEEFINQSPDTILISLARKVEK